MITPELVMRISLHRPSVKLLHKANASHQQLRLSYSEIGLSTGKNFPNGYDHDHNQIIIGEGRATFKKARSIIQLYGHFPSSWAFVHAKSIPEPNLSVAVIFYQLGLWWINGARIIQIIDEPNYYGFSYGTLANHVEVGEELFFTELQPDGAVIYGIHAYSQPRFWGARLFKPYARSQQRRFVQESMQLMRRQCKANAIITS